MTIWIKFNCIYFKSFTGLGFYVLHPWTLTADNSITQNVWFPDVLSNAQNRALKKRKLDSNPRYSPDTTSSWMHKQLCSINKQENYSKALHYKTLEQHKNLLISQQIINEGLTFQKTPSFLWSSNNILNG